MTSAFELALPATTANLGPGFDTVAMALSLRLRLKARRASEDSLSAVGRDADLCRQPRNHMILEVFRSILRSEGRPVSTVALHLDNQIPIGKGCGSSAAARLAGVALAAHFGQLGWDAQRIFEAAVALEGHADNVAACWWGGLVIAQARGVPAVHWLRVPVATAWPMILVLPPEPLATAQARQVLPESYGRGAVVANLQNAALMLQAFQQGRGDLMAEAMVDHLHQPFRAALCPLLPALAPLAGSDGILGCALSGAGPAVLLLLRDDACRAAAATAVEAELRRRGMEAELLPVSLELQGPGTSWSQT